MEQSTGSATEGSAARGNSPDTGPGAAAPHVAPLQLAPHHLRLFALLLDYIAIVAGVKLLEQVALGAHWDLRPEPSPAPWWLLMAALLILRDLPGLSLGKWLLDLAIRRQDDPAQPAAAWQRLVRNLSLVLLPIDGVLLFRDPLLRRWGERWAGTVVVLPEPARSPIQRALALGSLFLGFILAALLITPWNLRRSAAYQTAYPAAASAPALAQQLGAHPVLDTAPGLELNFPGGSARVTFDAAAAHNSKQTARVQVDLRLVPASGTVPARWEVTTVQVLPPESGWPVR